MNPRRLRTQTLLDRLAPAARQPALRGPLSEAVQLRQSILANLRRVLGTRLGHAAAQSELGIPAPVDLLQDYPACIPRLQKTIGACIQRYEPRLIAVRVHHLEEGDDALRIRFQITAELADGLHTRMVIDSQVDPTGHLEIGSQA
jgi:type VI secretion system lysozyme-like protein